MNSDAVWFGAIAQGATAVILLVTVIMINKYVKATEGLAADTNRIAEKHVYEIKEGRINNFLNKFDEMYPPPHDGRQLPFYLPAGINNLVDDQEIEEALTRLKNKYPKEYLDQGRDDAIRKVGCKKFFDYLVLSRKPFETIGHVDSLLKDLGNSKG